MQTGSAKVMVTNLESEVTEEDIEVMLVRAYAGASAGASVPTSKI
jgi:hypothetical protein